MALISGDKDDAATVVSYRWDSSAAICCDSTNNHDHRLATGCRCLHIHHSSLHAPVLAPPSDSASSLLTSCVPKRRCDLELLGRGTEIRLRDRLPKLQLIRILIRRSRTENPIS